MYFKCVHPFKKTKFFLSNRTSQISDRKLFFRKSVNNITFHFKLSPSIKQQQQQQQQQKKKMLRRSIPKFSLFSVLKEELGKAKEILAHDLTNYSKFLSGEDISEKEKKIREKHQELAQKDAQAAAEARSKLSWSEKMAAAVEELKSATKTNAAVVALVQHCARAHMAEIAVEQDIDIRNINIVTEGVKNEAGVEVEEKVIGYIEAPSATNEEVMVYAKKLERACPAARTHGGIEWRRSPNSNDRTPAPDPIENTNFSGTKLKKDDNFELPTGAGFGFTTSSAQNKKSGKNFVIDEEGFTDDVIDVDGKIASDLPHGSPFHDKQKQDLGSFKPFKKTGNDLTDMNRTAYDLAETLEKKKTKKNPLVDSTMLNEEDQHHQNLSPSELVKKFKEEREKERLAREAKLQQSDSTTTASATTTTTTSENEKASSAPTAAAGDVVLV
jgi:hypothetical protein